MIDTITQIFSNLPTDLIINLTYIASALLFIIGLKKLSSAKTARFGNFLSASGMLVAAVITLIDKNIVSFEWILMGLAIGSVIGILSARLVALTAMPEMVALLNGFGGISSLLLGCAAYYTTSYHPLFTVITIMLSIFIGGLTFSGSIVAWAKLSQKLPGRPLTLPLHHIINILILGGIIISSVAVCTLDFADGYFYLAIGLSLLLGILSVISIGGGDMPVVISLLNSYSGLAACAAGFAIQNILLIVAGSLVGASGIILTNIMCKAMNRSLKNVLFSGFGSTSQQTAEDQGEVNPINPEDAFFILEAATSVAIVPGYGLAVAQAQHSVKELGHLLEENGCEVKYAIHPVAGRMPGHMNVLLAEADVSYDQLVEMEQINPTLETVDICIVVGANDVVNPDARENETSPLYGMPIIDVDKAKTVFVLKRSMNAGFAGVENPLFFKPNTRMLFGDAKDSLQKLISEFNT